MYTIVIDETERRKQVENRINATVRHCRIGKVREKTGIRWMDQGIPPFKYDPPHTWAPTSPPLMPWWMQGPWCSQAVQ